MSGDKPSGMTQHELDRRLEELHRAGNRAQVVDLLRKYGLFTDEDAVQRYLNGEDE